MNRSVLIFHNRFLNALRFFSLVIQITICIGPLSACASGLEMPKLTEVQVLSHPRSLPNRESTWWSDESSIPTMLGKRTYDLISIPNPNEPPTELSVPVGVETSKQAIRLSNLVGEECTNVLLLAIHWSKSDDLAALENVKARSISLARWFPDGITGFRKNDQVGRTVAWTLALAYDWLFEQWTPAEHELLIAAISPLIEDMLSRDAPFCLDQGQKLDQWPFDSQGAVNFSQLAVICTNLVGTGRIFDDCYSAVVPRYVAQTIPWDGDDGGYSNETAYAHWDMLFVYFDAWDLLKNSLGIDFWQSTWARGYGNFMAYFLPPNAPSGLFGDEAERKFNDILATQAKVYSAHLSTLVDHWYGRALHDEQKAHIALVIGPRRDLGDAGMHLPASIPNAILIPSIGLSAMYSELGTRLRTFLYFKSSPFGSCNHSHADQNSFVIHSQGKALAIDSGYYDYYGSPHWIYWYKSTQAHNAITFDGGKGQVHDSMSSRGKVTNFETRQQYDLVTGDAREAYGGQLTRGIRSVTYIRPNTAIVFDSLEAAVPRSWE